MQFGGGNNGVSKYQADQLAKRAVKKAGEPKAGDLLKKYDTAPSDGHTRLDPKAGARPSEMASTKVDEEE